MEVIPAWEPWQHAIASSRKKSASDHRNESPLKILCE
jgi:hypothetical protein